jgi:hypothetical protein
MTSPKILNPNETYTFAKYAELPYERDDILADLGCTIESTRLSLDHSSAVLDLTSLAQQIQDNFQYTTLSSEQARREFLIAPIVSYVCKQTQQKVRVEYPIAVSNWLRGSLDYYFQAGSNLLIIEAKRENLYSGFTQLAAELLALDQWSDSKAPVLYGAVTTGQIWQFGQFQRSTRHLIEDLTLYRVLDELEALVRILIGIIQAEETIDQTKTKTVVR